MSARVWIILGSLSLSLAACDGSEKPSSDGWDDLYTEDHPGLTGDDSGSPVIDDTGSPVIDDTGGGTPAVDEDGDGFTEATGDCDETDPDINPGAVEVCDGVDNDCDGEIDVDAEDGQYWYLDEDSDDYGALLGSIWACEAPEGTSPILGDCDDTDPTIWPGAAEACDSVDNNCNGLIDESGAIGASPWFHDADRDGFGDPLDVIYSCNDLLGYAENDGDCDDSNSTVNPDATEICNGTDDNCDGTVDEGFPLETYYRDADGDLRGDPLVPLVSCAPPSGYVSSATDCDDSDDEVHAEMPELCDDKDNDCNGDIDDDVATYIFYRDADADGVGDASDSLEACALPSGYVIDPGDCDDTDASISPGMWELCNGIDDDCSGIIDDGLTFSTFYEDVDGDGYGNESSTLEACAVPVGYTADATDCDDTLDWVHPGIEADCADGVDEDCDGEVDEGPDRTWFEDADEDGFGNPSSSVTTCLMPEGYTPDATDCDDTNPDFFPDAREVCDDGADGDCDGFLDEEDVDCDCPDRDIVEDEDLGEVTGSSAATGSTTSEVDDVDGSCGSSGGRDYVYFWTAPDDGCYSFTTNGSTFDTLLLIYDGCEGTEVDCDDDSGEGLRSRIDLSGVEAGQTYFLVVDGYSTGSAGTYVLNINDC